MKQSLLDYHAKTIINLINAHTFQESIELIANYLQKVIDPIENKDFHQQKNLIRKYLQDHPGCLQSEVADDLGIDKSRVSRLIQEIRKEWRKNATESKGLVENQT